MDVLGINLLPSFLQIQLHAPTSRYISICLLRTHTKFTSALPSVAYSIPSPKISSSIVTSMHRGRFVRTLRLTVSALFYYILPEVDVFRGESRSCDEAREATSLPYSPLIRDFPTSFHDYRDSCVTPNPSGIQEHTQVTTNTLSWCINTGFGGRAVCSNCFVRNTDCLLASTLQETTLRKENKAGGEAFTVAARRALPERLRTIAI
jgi:hypothetical protein